MTPTEIADIESLSAYIEKRLLEGLQEAHDKYFDGYDPAVFDLLFGEEECDHRYVLWDRDRNKLPGTPGTQSKL